MAAIGRTTEWHEIQQKYEVSKASKRNDLQIKQELEQANQEIKIIRRHKLKQLYEREMEEFEAELNSKGLAIVKDRA